MSVKEIRELEGELREVSVDESVADRDDWGEGGFVEDEEDDEEFSIGDTMLARGEVKEKWNNESLEDVVDWEASEDFEEDEGDMGFSYEPAGGDNLGDLYGSSNIGNLYGSGNDGSDLYNNSGTGGENSVSLYNTSGAAGGKSYLNNVTGTSGKKVGIVNYEVAGAGGEKKQRRNNKSGLESGARRKRGGKKGVSLI